MTDNPGGPLGFPPILPSCCSLLSLFPHLARSLLGTQPCAHILSALLSDSLGGNMPASTQGNPSPTDPGTPLVFASPPGASGYVFTEPERTFLLSQETVSWSRLGGPQTHIPSTGPRQLQRITSGIPLKCSFSAPATDLQRIR